MAEKPAVGAAWGTVVVNEPISQQGATTLVTNKVEPTEAFKSTGVLARQPFPRPYLNYQFDVIARWLEHLDERYIVGDFHYGGNLDNATDVSVRLGGTWVDHGTTTVLAQTVRLFEKTV